MSDTPKRGFIVLEGNSRINDLQITRTTVDGAPMIDSRGGSIGKLNVSASQIYNSEAAFLLGDTFQAKFDDIKWETNLPEVLVSAINEAKGDVDKQTKLRKRLTEIVTDPRQFLAVITIAEKVWSAGAQVLSRLS